MPTKVRWGAVAMGALYLASGVTHFVATGLYVQAVPGFLPEPRALVLESGVAEIAGGFGVMLPWTRRAASWGLVALLVAVFPANVWMAMHPERFAEIPRWVLWMRLPLQVPLIWWAWRYSKVEL